MTKYIDFVAWQRETHKDTSERYLDSMKKLKIDGMDAWLKTHREQVDLIVDIDVTVRLLQSLLSSKVPSAGPFPPTPASYQNLVDFSFLVLVFSVLSLSHFLFVSSPTPNIKIKVTFIIFVLLYLALVPQDSPRQPETRDPHTDIDTTDL
jgi:hypothetical protein